MPDLIAPPVPTPSERRSQATFQALLWALSRPGQMQTLEGDPYLSVADALLDLEVSAYTTAPDLTLPLRRSGARLAEYTDAEYLFYRRWDASTLAELDRVRVGTPLAPDESATLLLPAMLDGSGRPFTLTGPGVNGSLSVQIGGVPDGFWTLREAVCHFPLGWDVFFVDGAAGVVLGLPRTTTVEVK